jgi:hypothetical protein
VPGGAACAGWSLVLEPEADDQKHDAVKTEGQDPERDRHGISQYHVLEEDPEDNENDCTDANPCGGNHWLFFVDFLHTRGIMDPVNIIFFGEKRAPERALH